MNYNLLNYPGTDATTRNPYFREIISSVDLDIIAVQEMTSQAGVDGFKNKYCSITILQVHL
jgi:endonuclease/exonuclease/phosphatase family metal-dependent hydrolase